MICEEFRETLEQEGYEVDCALSGMEGLRKIQKQKYGMVFLDASMPSLDGAAVLKKIRTFSQVPVTVISGFLTSSREKEMMNEGVFACLRKPLDLDRVKSLIQVAEKRRGKS